MALSLRARRNPRGPGSHQPLYHTSMSSDRHAAVDDQTLRLRQILDSSPALIHTGTPDGSLDFFNRTWCEFVGKPVEALHGWGWTTCVHPDDIGVLLERWRESIATGNPLEVEARVRRADGEFRWMLHQKIARRNADGEVIQWHGSSVDIEARKQAEDSLRKKVEELQTNKYFLSEAQRLGQMGSWSFDPSLGFDHWSPELFLIHGLEPRPEAPTSEAYLALVHREDREFMASLMNQLHMEPSGFDVTKRIVRPDGQLRYIRCVGSAGSETGGLKRIGVGVDVTEHELLTQELRRREAHLAEAQRLGHIGSWVFEPTGAFEYWSDELFRIFGLDPGRDAPTLDEYLACVHQHDREFMALRIKRVVAEASGCDVIQRIVRPNGEVRYIRCVGTPVLENGTLKRIVGSAIDVTEHELLTRELRRREAYLAEAQRLSQTGSFGWKPGSGEIAWSNETYRIFEYDPAEKITLDLIMERAHPEDRTLALEFVERASTGDGAIDCEHRLLFPDDRVKYIRVLARPLEIDSDGLELAGAVIDITEAKRAEERIRLSESELRTLVETIPAFVGTALPDGSCDFLSESWLDYLGFTLEQGLGWGWADSIHPEDFDRVVANWRAGLTAREPVEQELRCRSADGTYHWFLNRNLPLRDNEGNVIKWYGTLTNIDAMKETEQALQTREHELLGIIETIPAMLFSASPAGEPTHLSQRFLDYYGATFEELDNRRWVNFIHPDDREETVKTFFRAIETGESFNVIHRLRRLDGEYRWHNAMGAPLHDPGGTIIQWYGLVIDIDEQKRAEDRLRDTSIRLSTASKIATVAELSASIAHELNQPLMAVLGNAQAARRWLAANPPDLTETNASIERILRDIRSADEAMQHIRALFKSEPYEKSDESVLDILRESIRFVHEDPNKREVLIDWSIEDSLPPICVDRIQTQQVFINLISNAIEATDGSANAARILLKAFVTQEHEVIVQVIDNGMGLADTTKIFDAFMTTKKKGMGIGLTVSRTIVEAHGGRLWAENNRDGGAIFSVALPVSPKPDIG
jgi:PAS domain S-box-containing protein